MPPSVDDVPGKLPPAGKPARGGKRRPGKQPGAPGAALAWDDAVDADSVVDHFLAGSCVCGAELADAADLGVTARHQQVEIPLVVAERQHDLHTVMCGCGRVHTAPRPEGVPAAPVSLGPNLQAWCVYLMVAHVVCCDETPLRVGPGKAKGYLLVACDPLFTWYMLGDRTLASFKDFILSPSAVFFGSTP